MVSMITLIERTHDAARLMGVFRSNRNFISTASQGGKRLSNKRLLTITQITLRYGVAALRPGAQDWLGANTRPSARNVLNVWDL